MLLAVALFLSLASPSPAPGDPYVIYRSAMLKLATLDQPAYIDDTDHWLATTIGIAGATSENEWLQRTIFNSVTRRECNLFVPFRPFRASDPPSIGESYFAPDIWLISRKSQPPSGSNQPNMAPDLSDLRIIASVVSVAKPSYEIRLAGIEPLNDGGSAYHLTLRPLSDPHKHNLRELWVNTANDLIMRAIIEGNYRPSYSLMLQDTFVLEDFGNVGGYWLVIHHVWTDSEPFTNSQFQYNVTSITMRFPATVPDWFFDTRAFLRHLGDVNTALADI